LVEGATGRVIGRNILANALGGSWFAILSLVIIPIQIRILGVDAYGLLAFIASLQFIFSIFDLGLSPTIAREVAIDTSPDLLHSRALLQTLSVAYGAIGLLLGGILILSAGWLVSNWLNLGLLPPESAKSALQLAGLAIMLRWPVSFLSSVLIGCGRFDILNLLKAGAATFGLLGGSLVILSSENLVVFAAWMVLAAFVEVMLYLVACFRLVPRLTLRPRVSRRSLAKISDFARDVSLISILAIVVTQSDRLLLSRLAPIETLGYYSLAYNVLLGLTLAQGFITSALFPSFAAKQHSGARDELVSDFNWATQGLVYIYTLPIGALTFFGYDILRIWTSAETATNAAQILSILAPGFLLNASLSIAYTLAVATGNTRIVIRANLMALVFFLPILFLAIVRWGGVGAAGAWLLLNLLYFVTLLPPVQEHIAGQSTRSWLRQNLLPFLVLGVLSFGIGRSAITLARWHGDLAIWFVLAVSALMYGLGGLWLLNPALRRQVWISVMRMMATP
jgi:O-antigen/teichoic acid export membrane protein